MKEGSFGDLEARLDAVERDLARLASELAFVRAAVRARATETPPVTSPPLPAPAAPPFRPPSSPPKAPTVQSQPQRAPAPPPAPVPVAAAAPASGPPPRTLGELARDWDLVGPRGFAVVGGGVTALGIGLFFVLAANRGWIDPTARVLLGAIASALVLGAGLFLRARYGQYLSALAAVGAGIAGSYATLAAASARYDLVPDPLALPLAGVIAAVATAIALRWQSQIIAVLGLLGAALAPALQALDTHLTWQSAAFAVIVFAASLAVSLPYGWHRLLLTSALVVGAQVEWLIEDANVRAGLGTVVVVAAFVGVLIATSIGRRLVQGQAELAPPALGYALAATGLTFLFAIQLFDDRTIRGSALLAAAAVWALAFLGLEARRVPDLALVMGTSALAVAAVGTADLVSDAALTLAWAAEAVVFAVVASRFRDARLQATSLVYAVLAAGHALVAEGRLDLLFDRHGGHLEAVLPLAAAAIGFAASGVLAPREYEERTETGLLAFIAGVRAALATHRRGGQEAALFAAAVFGTLAGSFGLVDLSFEWGHVGASTLAAAVGAGILVVAGRRRSDPLAFTAYYWLGVVLAETLVYDLDDISVGGWAVITSSAALLVGAYAHRLLVPSSKSRDLLCGAAAVIAAFAGSIGIGDVAETDAANGLGLLLACAVFVPLAAGVFRRDGFRDVSTTLWSLGLVLLVGAESFLVTDAVSRSVVIAATALAVGALGSPLAEMRLWLAGDALALTTSAIVGLVQVQPWLDQSELQRKEALALGACAIGGIGLAAVRFREERWRDLVTLLCLAGIASLLATERVLVGDWQATAFTIALTGAGVAALAQPLRESRLWSGGAVIVGATTYATIATFTPPSHLFTASVQPASGVWVLLACLVAIVVLALTNLVPFHRSIVYGIGGALAVYALSLGFLDVAERISTASIETDFERGHTAVSALWALVGLALLLAGVVRGSAVVRIGGLALFGLTLVKIFLYDLAELSSIARAFSFILVGGLLLAGGFFLQRLSDRVGPSSP
jgi:uncharacterized membrane protein